MPLATTPGCRGYEEPAQPFGAVATSLTSDEQGVFEALEAPIDRAPQWSIFDGPAIGPLLFWGPSLQWNPLSQAWAGECLDDNAGLTPYYVNCYGDAGGRPGALLASRAITPSAILDTGADLYGASIFRYEGAVSPPVPTAGVRWIALRRQTGSALGNGNQCLFLWIAEGNTSLYDDRIVQRDVGVPATNVTTTPTT